MANSTQTDKQVIARLGETSQVSTAVGQQGKGQHAVGIREVVVRLEEQLAGGYEKEKTIKTEAVEDGYCFVIDKDIVEENHAGENFQEHVIETMEIDGGDDPSGSSARLTRYLPRPWPQKKNMTYSHEQRIRMGYFAAKCGMKALKNKYVGMKDSTGRDMVKQVLQMVREGKLSLNIPIEKQIIPPKMRNGAPVVGTFKVLVNREPQQDGAEETAMPQSLRQRDTGEKAALQKAQIGVSPEVADYDELLSLHVPFEDKVKIGYLAALHGSHVAVRKFEVTDSLVKECRNLTIKLSRSGHLNLGIPLEDQVIPEDPSRIIPTRLANNDQPSQAKMHAGLPQLQPENRASIQDLAQVDMDKHTMHCENLDPIKPKDQPISVSSQRSLSGQTQLGNRDISLGTDLTFLRWRNRRTSLGFQSDYAFAMHLMDVHDAFCTGQCCGRDTTLSNERVTF